MSATSAFIGGKVRHLATDHIGYVTTYYDNGDLMVRVSGSFERWATVDVLPLGRWS